MTRAASAKHQRCQVTLDEIEGLRITIPMDLAASEGCLLVAGFFFWVMIEIIGLFLLFDAIQGTRHVGEASIPARFLFVAACTVAGAAYVFWLIPWKGRRESIVIDGDQLTIRREHGLPVGARSYPLARIRNLRFSPRPSIFDPARSRETPWGFAGNIAFDYDGATIRIAPGLEETECRRLIRTIKDRYKIADDREEPLAIERL